MAGETSELEATFARYLSIYQIGGWVREYRFALDRRFRFDFAWVDKKVAVECEGGVWTQGAHGRGSGISRDIEKYNLAACLGWKVLRFSATMLRDPEACMAAVKMALEEVSDG